MKILTKYTIKQFLIYSGLGLMLFSFILLMDRVFDMASLVINKGVGVLNLLTLLGYSLPTIIVLAMPMAVVAGAILSYGKMASEGEITTIRTSGNTLKPAIIPVMAVTLVISALMLPFNYYTAPRSQFAFRKLFMNIAYRDPTLHIEESALVEIPPYTLLCFEVDREEHRLNEVMIIKDENSDEPPLSITARSGIWKTNKHGELILRLRNGTIKEQPERKKNRFISGNFNEYSLVIKPPESIGTINKETEAMTATELKEKINILEEEGKATHELLTHFHLRSSLAGAVFILLTVSIPFGIRAEKKGKTIGIGISLGIIAVYYFLTVAGLKLAFDGFIPPFFGAWLANIITATGGGILLYKSYHK